MSPQECFNAGKSNKEIKFVGLQFGGQCWGGKTNGKYGKVADSECSMQCRKDSSAKCGNANRNSVYDLSSGNKLT